MRRIFPGELQAFRLDPIGAARNNALHELQRKAKKKQRSSTPCMVVVALAPDARTRMLALSFEEKGVTHYFIVGAAKDDHLIVPSQQLHLWAASLREALGPAGIDAVRKRRSEVEMQTHTSNALVCAGCSMSIKHGEGFTKYELDGVAHIACTECPVPRGAHLVGFGLWYENGRTG